MSAIYHLTNTGGYTGYDSYHGFVVRAKSPVEARKLAAGRDATQPKIWLDSKLSTCDRLGTCPATKNFSEVILGDFHAG